MTEESDYRLADRSAIGDVLIRYGAGLNTRDYEVVASCFAKEVTAEYAGEILEPGVDGILGFIRRSLPTFAMTMHYITNVAVEFDGVDRAVSSCYCIAYLLHGDGGDQLLVRGVRYVDKFERRDGRWLIVDRRHLPTWMTEQTSQTPAL